MSVKWRTIGIFGGIILLLISGCYFLFRDNTEEKTMSIPIFKETAVSSPHKIEVKNRNGAYTMTFHPPNLYGIEELEDKRQNNGLTENIFIRIMNLSGAVMDENQERNHKTYGFDNPQAVVTIFFPEGSSQELIIGNKSSIMNGYFAMKQGEEKIYLLESHMVEVLEKSKDEYENKMLLDFTYESDYKKLSEITLSGEDLLTIKFRKENEEFYMMEPITYGCMQAQLKEKFLNPLMHLKGDTNTEQKRSKEMGFEQPQYDVEFLYGGEKIQILVGKTIGDSSYITRTDREEVYLIGNEKLKFLKADYKSLVGDYVYYRSIAQVTAMEIEYEDKKCLLKVEKRGRTYEAIPEGKTDAAEDFIPLYNQIIQLPIAGLADEKDGIEGEIRIQISLKDGRSETLLFSKKNEREYKVSINGICEFTTFHTNVTLIIEKLNEILAS